MEGPVQMEDRDMEAEIDHKPLLQVEHLTITVQREGSPQVVVDDVSWELYPGEVVGIVGESGSGKSISVLALLGLLPDSAEVRGGRVSIRGVDMATQPESAWKRVRGNEVGIVFQDPMTSFNPVRTVGSQVAEAIKLHNPQLAKSARLQRVLDLFTSVGIPNASLRYRQYPHEFSGGMRQRAMIAMALANSPSVLIADEPTTALDVTTQAQVVDLLHRLQQDTRTAIVFISHDLGVVADLCDRVLVMYAGKVVESGPVVDILTRPAHPYTQALLRARPRLGDGRSVRLTAIGGQPPDHAHAAAGCSFHPRCARGEGELICQVERPVLLEAGRGHRAACHFVGVDTVRESTISSEQGR